jgi:hypothetical protein
MLIIINPIIYVVLLIVALRGLFQRLSSKSNLLYKSYVILV